MIFYLYMIYLMIFSLLFFFFSLLLLMKKILFMTEYEVMKLMSVKFELVFFCDWISLMFISVVMMISSMVILYSVEYMSNDNSLNRFMILIIMFVSSMILMILSPNLLSILFGWDGLGVVSYCLVIYYQNYNSFNSGMVTILMNRIGDVMILMSLSMSMYFGSWTFLIFFNLKKFIMIMIFISAITKSAQIPFSSWLPMAMAAPTPVSSLVHSSTLVTAGVYLLIRFNYLMMDWEGLMKWMMLVSSMTLFMSGVAANMEMDLKKIIALSTLSQLGIMIFCLSINLKEVSYFHLVSHAMFKSMLFMCAGVIIHNMHSYQDIRLLGMIFYNMPLISVLFNCATLSLCGIPFLSGFYSKDMILEFYMMTSVNKFYFIMVFVSMGFTVSYSLRLIYYSFLKMSKICIYTHYCSINSLMSVSMMILFMLTIFMGSFLSWILFSLKNEIFLSQKFKLMIYMFMIMGLILGEIMFFIKVNWCIYMLMNDTIKFISYLWVMMLIYEFISNQILIKSNIYIFKIEGAWNEYLMGGCIIKFLNKLLSYYIFNKIFMSMLFLMIYFFILLVLIK